MYALLQHLSIYLGAEVQGQLAKIVRADELLDISTNGRRSYTMEI